MTISQRRKLLLNLSAMVLKGEMSADGLLPHVIEDPDVQRRLLSRLMAAEGHENNRLFGALAQASNDEDLKKKLKRHAADERRHAKMLKELLDELGLEPEPAPDEGYLDILSRVGVMEEDVALVPFLASLVHIEQKALLILDATRRGLAPEHPIHRTLSEIHADELRHIAWVSEYLLEVAKEDPSAKKVIEQVAAADHYANAVLRAVGPVGAVKRLRALSKLARAMELKATDKLVVEELKDLLNKPLNGDLVVKNIFKKAIEGSKAPPFIKRLAKAA